MEAGVSRPDGVVPDPWPPPHPSPPDARRNGIQRPRRLHATRTPHTPEASRRAEPPAPHSWSRPRPRRSLRTPGSSSSYVLADAVRRLAAGAHALRAPFAALHPQPSSPTSPLPYSSSGPPTSSLPWWYAHIVNRRPLVRVRLGAGPRTPSGSCDAASDIALTPARAHVTVMPTVTEPSTNGLQASLGSHLLHGVVGPSDLLAAAVPVGINGCLRSTVLSCLTDDIADWSAPAVSQTVNGSSLIIGLHASFLHGVVGLSDLLAAAVPGINGSLISRLHCGV